MKNKNFYAAIILLLFLAIGIQSAIAINIPADTSIGTWDPDNRIYTLTTDVSYDVYGTINIGEDDLTLNGNGHLVSGPGVSTATSGILLSGRTDVTVKSVTLENFYYGITLEGGSQNNTLTCNTIKYNQYGIRLSNSDLNEVSGNTVSNNGFSAMGGICLYWADSNVIKGNTISNNYNGIVLSGTSLSNQVYNNNFLSNTKRQAYVLGALDATSGNAFNLAFPPTGGNYWSNWTTPDADDDGIVDNPYVLKYEYGPPPNPIQDDFPWVSPNWPNQPPVANAGPDRNVEGTCQTGGAIQVTLNGNGSYDPDGDTLSSYTWTGPFVEGGGTANGATPTVTLDPGYLGDHEITLVVNDGELNSAPDTVIITVVDTTPPVISCPGDIWIEIQSPDGVPVDDEQVLTFLAGASATDNCDPEPTITNDAPTEFLPPGDTVVTFTATDASANSSTCQSTVTVMEVKGNLRIVPPIINRDGRLQRILAVIRFPEGTAEEDIDIGPPLMLFPGDSLDGIEATSQRIIQRSRRGNVSVSIFAYFSKDEVTDAVPEDGQVEMMVIGRFMSGEYFFGIDTVRIISWDWGRW